MRIAIVGSLLGAFAGAAIAQAGPVVGTLEVTGDSLFSNGRLGGVSVGPDGTIYVSNFRAEVWRITPAGRATLLAQTLRGSSGNTVANDGSLLQGSFLGNSIYRIATDGRMETYAEGLNGPVGMVMDSAGVLYVCNCRNNTIARVDTDRTVRTMAVGDLFACPNSIAFGPDGALYVVSYSNGNVVQVGLDGTTALVATLPDGGNAHIVYARGAFYVTRIAQNQIYRVAPDGTFAHVAGTGESGYDDGPGLDATFAHPNGIAVDPTGRVLYTNTLVGEWKVDGPSHLVIRTITLAR